MIRIGKEKGIHLLEDYYKAYVKEWTNKFMQLHANEEELNRQFIDIYGLHNELTPDVPLDEITILQHEEIFIADGNVVWHPDVVMKRMDVVLPLRPAGTTYCLSEPFGRGFGTVHLPRTDSEH